MTSVRHTHTLTNDSVGVCSTVLLQLTELPHIVIIEQAGSELLHLFFSFMFKNSPQDAINRPLTDSGVLFYKSFVFTCLKFFDIPKKVQYEDAASPTVLGQV